MRVYHGTSAKALKQIKVEGVDEPSYWSADYARALDYAASHGKGVVIAVDLEDHEFKANMGVARCLWDNGDIDQLPDEDDLSYSLEYLEGVVCHARIRDFEVVDTPPSAE